MDSQGIVHRVGMQIEPAWQILDKGPTEVEIAGLYLFIDIVHLLENTLMLFAMVFKPSEACFFHELVFKGEMLLRMFQKLYEQGLEYGWVLRFTQPVYNQSKFLMDRVHFVNTN
ncbi:hypothetical protein SAMN04488056_101499 [Cohaesibacter marisflavi]|uniref:Uncharacterized protein n=1 Tax=Cohaesibacter marisflavi TaxID=655353 RepID=A0A1I5AHY4_9HYPH|nr:hypothetical protein SAMN04488056_101499 [Cohaesibacter marisflavi]